MNDSTKELELSVRGRVLHSESLQGYTTYRTGGAAEVLIEPAAEINALAIDNEPRPYDITDGGIEVYPTLTVFR